MVHSIHSYSIEENEILNVRGLLKEIRKKVQDMKYGLVYYLEPCFVWELITIASCTPYRLDANILYHLKNAHVSSSCYNIFQDYIAAIDDLHLKAYNISL